MESRADLRDEGALESDEVVVVVGDLAIEVARKWRSVDDGPEMRGDRRRQGRCVTEARAHLRGEALECTLDEERRWCDIEIGLRAPELLAQSADLQRSKGPLGERENDVAHGVRDGAALQLTMRRGHRAEYQPSRAARSAR